MLPPRPSSTGAPSQPRRRKQVRGAERSATGGARAEYLHQQQGTQLVGVILCQRAGPGTTRVLGQVAAPPAVEDPGPCGRFGSRYRPRLFPHPPARKKLARGWCWDPCRGSAAGILTEGGPGISHSLPTGWRWRPDHPCPRVGGGWPAGRRGDVAPQGLGEAWKGSSQSWVRNSW